MTIFGKVIRGTVDLVPFTPIIEESELKHAEIVQTKAATEDQEAIAQATLDTQSQVQNTQQQQQNLLQAQTTQVTSKTYLVIGAVVGSIILLLIVAYFLFRKK